jgi:hypothetical protein
MPEPVYHHSWSGMRGVLSRNRRRWMTWGEFAESLALIHGLRPTHYLVKQILAADPPAKVNGGYRYEMRHLGMVQDYYRNPEAGAMTDQQKREAIATHDDVMERIGKVVENYHAGGLSYPPAAKTIEELLDEPARVVRVGTETHTPEVQS